MGRIPRARLALLLVAPLLATATSCGRPDASHRDLLLITVDTLRPDYLGAYGHPRSTSACFDELSESGVLFERHHTTSSQTAPAHASLFSGLFPSEHGLRKNGQRLNAELPLLAEVLQQAGYETRALLAFRVLDRRFGFDRGFDEFDDEIRNDARTVELGPRNWQRRADAVVDSALASLREAPLSKPLFVWVHLFDPHAPYASQAPADLDPALGRDVLRARTEPGELFKRKLLVDIALQYEAEVRFTFDAVARLIEGWDARRPAERTVIAITSDHGEALGEHEFLEHDLFTYQEQLHIPFVLRATGRLPTGARIANTTSAVDVPATLAELCGVGFDELGGRSLVNAIDFHADTPSIIAERPPFADFDLERNVDRARALAAHGDGPGSARTPQVACIEWPWKLIQAEGAAPELYNLEQDPGEQLDRSADSPEALKQLQGILASWRAGLGTPPETSTVLDDDVSEMLDALGY